MKKINIKKWSGIIMAIGSAIIAFADVWSEHKEKEKIEDFEERLSQLENKES